MLGLRPLHPHLMTAPKRSHTLQHWAFRLGCKLGWRPGHAWRDFVYEKPFRRLPGNSELSWDLELRLWPS